MSTQAALVKKAMVSTGTWDFQQKLQRPQYKNKYLKENKMISSHPVKQCTQPISNNNNNSISCRPSLSKQHC